MNDRVKLAAIYVRISQDREGAGLGVARQEADCRELAAKEGYEVVGVYADNDISAYSGKPRPAYQRLLADVKAGRLDAVLAWHTDRLHRSPRELEDYITATEKHDVETHTVRAGLIDLSKASGKVHARMLGTFARYESDIKSERVRAAMKQKAQRGESMGGAIPLGWKRRVRDGAIVLDRSAARRIRLASEAVIAGSSLGSIIREWNEAGFTSANGKPWVYATVRQVLLRPRNAGRIHFRGELVSESPWPAILDEDIWRQAVAVLSDPARRKSQSNRVKHLMVGIAVCGTCGAPMKSVSISNVNGGRPRQPVTYYRCTTPGKGHVARHADQVDEQVRATVGAWLQREDIGGLLISDDGSEDLADLRAEAVALRGRLTEVAESFADGLLTRAQLEAASSKISTRLSAIEEALTRATASSAASTVAAAPDPAKAFRDAPIDRQRAIVRELVTVTILPKPKGARREYDPAQTVVEPRLGAAGYVDAERGIA